MKALSFVDRQGRTPTVELDEDGYVFHDGERIGWVEKGHRTYSPPIHRGSPIARYHKRVPCWRASGTKVTFDTRKAAIEHLLRGLG